MLALLLNRWAQLAVGVAAALLVGFASGHHLKTLEDAGAQVASLKQTVAQVEKSAQATSVIDQKSAAAQAATQANTESLLQKVPTYVPPKADAQCIVGVGAVRLLDAAAQDAPVPSAAVGLQTANSGVALSEVISDDIANAGSYHTLAERLKAWDDWWDAQAAIAAGKTPQPTATD